MKALVRFERVSPLTGIQDAGRFGMLAHGVAASGPMDRAGFDAAGFALGGAGFAGVEFTASGVDLTISEGACRAGFAGGQFLVTRNGKRIDWPGAVDLKAGDTLSIRPGPSGNYGYLRFDAEIAVPKLLGSRAANLRAGLGRVLAAGETLGLEEADALDPGAPAPEAGEGPIRVLWGLHAEVFPGPLRERMLSATFAVSTRLDRMGVRLLDPEGVFAGFESLSLVSDAVVPGDIQILGDGTPVVLMRDHQPTGGYPRIATIVGADFGRFAQFRPGTPFELESVSLSRAQELTGGGRT